jgi:tetratricopeptide (TPR) repeat protein
MGTSTVETEQENVPSSVPLTVAKPAPAQKPAKEKTDFKTAFADFLSQNRRPMIIILIVLAVVLVLTVAGILVFNGLRSSSISKVEALADRYTALSTEVNLDERSADVEQLLEDMLSLGSSSFGYAATRSYMLAGGLRAAQLKWEEAASYYETAAQKGAKTYLASVARYNAASAWESAANTEKALENFRLAAADLEFPASVHAQFNVGRLLEASDPSAAEAAYEQIATSWPNETVWINLAESRIISLSIK